MPPEGLHNEKDLLARVSQGDREAFQLLYTACYSDVQHYISLFEPSAEALDELTQDVFVRIWEKRSLLAGVDSFRNYLFLMTRNVVLNFIRALKVRQTIIELDDTMSVGHRETENELLFKQYYRLALDAMAALSPGRRKILKMSIDEGLTLDEIAARLHISRSAVKNQLYSAMAFVRQYLRDHGEIGLAMIIFLSLFE